VAIRRLEPHDSDPAAAKDSYVAALKMLARRELSEAQIRQRLSRKGHSGYAIDEAVVRLRQERAIDDTRVAEAIAHTEVSVRRHGRLRVLRQIEQAGIAPETARGVVNAVFGELDGEALLDASLARRLRGATLIDDKQTQRLYRYLIGQGFEPDRVIKALKKHRRHKSHGDE
jgi:regulatory protein